MTQIKKTLSIAGIIALVTAPAMAEIASTAYVQNIVNNIIPTSGTVGDVLKKTSDGFEWAAAPTTTLETTTGSSTTSGMTQKAITDALNGKMTFPSYGLDNDAVDDTGLVLTYFYEGELEEYMPGWINPLSFLPDNILYGGDDSDMLIIGDGADVSEGESVAIGPEAYVGSTGGGVAIGYHAKTNGGGAIQLGKGTYTGTGLGVKGYELMNGSGIVPYQRLAPTPDTKCQASVGQKCALVVTWDGSKYVQSWEAVKSN